jgi:hypothetical protein
MRAFFEGGPFGVEGDEAVAFEAERCMNCDIVSNCWREWHEFLSTFIVMRRLDIVFGVFEDILRILQQYSRERVIVSGDCCAVEVSRL